MFVLSRVPKDIWRRRLKKRETQQRHLIPERDGERCQAAERMADEVYRTASPSNDPFKDFGLVRNICVESGATLGRPAISEQACRYTMEAIPPVRDDGPPGCACAARSRN
jgi:hypothetical protein